MTREELKEETWIRNEDIELLVMYVEEVTYIDVTPIKDLTDRRAKHFLRLFMIFNMIDFVEVEEKLIAKKKLTGKNISKLFKKSCCKYKLTNEARKEPWKEIVDRQVNSENFINYL